MPPIDLANIKTRLIGCGAIQVVGQTISTAIGVSTGATAGIVGGSIAVVGVSALGAIAYILKEVARSDELIAIAETKHLPYQAEPLTDVREIAGF